MVFGWSAVCAGEKVGCDISIYWLEVQHVPASCQTLGGTWDTCVSGIPSQMAIMILVWQSFTQRYIRTYPKHMTHMTTAYVIPKYLTGLVSGTLIDAWIQRCSNILFETASVQHRPVTWNYSVAQFTYSPGDWKCIIKWNCYQIVFVLHCRGNNEKGNVYACSVQMQVFFFSWTSWCMVSCSCGYVTHRLRVTMVYVWVPAAHLCTKYIRAQDLRTVTFFSYSSVQSCLLNSFLRGYVWQ